jgi:hypothetical protein
MVEYQVRYKQEHYSNPYGSICGSYSVTSYSENFHTIKEAEAFISSLRGEEGVSNIQLFECKGIKC